MVWKPVKNVFNGGTEEAKKLLGSKVRLLHPVSITPINSKSKETIDFKSGLIGLVGYVPEEKKDEIRIAFPNDQKNVPKNLNSMMMQKDGYSIIQVNWPTFKDRFEIDQ